MLAALSFMIKVSLSFHLLPVDAHWAVLHCVCSEGPTFWAVVLSALGLNAGITPREKCQPPLLGFLFRQGLWIRVLVFEVRLLLSRRESPSGVLLIVR